MMRDLIISGLVALYRFWHGTLGLKGAGMLLRTAARHLRVTQHPAQVAGLGRITINPADSTGTGWLNYGLGESGNEEGLLSAIANAAPECPVIWDVGASGGMVFAALLRRLSDYRHVHLFEPNRSLIPTLTSLSQLLPRVFVNQVALSDQTGRAVLNVPYYDSSTGSFAPARRSLAIQVAQTTGDAFVEETRAECPDVVIIDTEGHDCHVIRGLRNTIARKRPHVFFEHIFVSDDDIAATLPAGYLHFTVDDRSGELIRGLQRSRGHNSVFVPQQQ